ncbi:MAG: tetratricopeptide repeat protein [Pseudomonadota bacterium]|nr:tetratricopeptide repeat protein [Pseudomonadota bacterium]
MQALDVNALFARAEQAFAAGRIDAARADLTQVQRLAGDHPAVLHLLALVEKKLGKTESARSAFAKALRLDPRNAEIAMNAGNFYSGCANYESGLAAYEQALAAKPAHLPAMRGRALCLARLSRSDEARTAYRRAVELAPADAKTWIALGAFERDEGNLQAAAASFDRALTLAPTTPAAVHGRARVALERGEEDAARRFAEAERLLPDDPQVALGAAEAAVAVDQEDALRRLKAVIARFPDWAEPQAALARLRWERGERETFTAALEAALAERNRNADLWRTLVRALSGVDRHIAAADAAARARAALGTDPLFQLLEAANASEGGDLRRADALFAVLPPVDGSQVAEARHRLKSGDPDRAEELLDTAREQAPEDVAAWAWTGLVWRVKGDDRAEWLYRPRQLARPIDLEIDHHELEAIATEIVKLHHAVSFPIGQSLRGGTQTRGRLFDRPEEPVARLRESIMEALHAYWAALPGEDSAHPLLRQRNAAPRLGGSWSVRLTDGGFHVAHIHPLGLLSSACYLRLPPAREGGEGWLELGRAPTDMGLDLPPLLTIEPRPGRLALFPSYMFHGTVPFQEGERLTVAFDIVPR